MSGARMMPGSAPAEASRGAEAAQRCYRVVHDCCRMSEEGEELLDEAVALEVPVSISYNGVYYNVLSCTPRDLEDEAYGFSLSSGIIESASDIATVEVQCSEGSYDVNVRLREGLRVDPAAFRLCAVSGQPRRDDALALAPYFPARMVHLPASEPIAREAIWRAACGLKDRQDMHLETGATHAAAFMDKQGEFLYVREDVGRHNAVDKLIGALARAKVDPRDGFVFLSSRCALELVNKLARFGVPLVATVSAPTSAVLDFAEEANVTLCAFARGSRFTIYTHPERIL